MNNKDFINDIKHLSFNQLKSKLHTVTDKKQSLVIRKLMLAKYQKHIENKHTGRDDNNNDNDNDSSSYGDIIDLNDQPPKMTSLNELDDQEIHDSRKIKEFSRDTVNNNIMDRLDGDMNIRQSTKLNKPSNKKTNKPTIIPPYADQADNSYASFVPLAKTNYSLGAMSSKSFSNKRVNKYTVK